MNKRSILTVAIAAFLSLPLAVTAADKKKGGMDKNGDGKVSKAEYTEATKDMKSKKSPEERFAALDKNGDGFLSKEELAAAQKGKKKK